MAPCPPDQDQLQREQGVRGLLVYCADYTCSHSLAISGDQWPDDMRLSDLDPKFVCPACGKRGADVRPDFSWDKARSPVSSSAATERAKVRRPVTAMPAKNFSCASMALQHFPPSLHRSGELLEEVLDAVLATADVPPYMDLNRSCPRHTRPSSQLPQILSRRWGCRRLGQRFRKSGLPPLVSTRAGDWERAEPIRKHP